MAMSERLMGLSMVLIGVLLLFESVGSMYLLMQVGWLLEILTGYQIPVGGMTIEMPSFQTYLSVGWGFSVFMMITGVLAVGAGMSFLVKKPAAPETERSQ